MFALRRASPSPAHADEQSQPDALLHDGDELPQLRVNGDRSNAEARRRVHVWLEAAADVFEGLPVRFVVRGLTVDAPHVATDECVPGESSWLPAHCDPGGSSWLPDRCDRDALPVVLSL